MDLDHEDISDQHDRPDPALAQQACVTCRKQKRKCDKRWPTCSLCRKNGRTCDYSIDSATAPGPSADEFYALQQKVADLERLLSASPTLARPPSSQGGVVKDVLSSQVNLLRTVIEDDPSIRPTSPSHQNLFFLDSTSFEYGRVQIQLPHVAVPAGALSVLGSSAKLRAMIEQYFLTVHTYFPIISKIRLYQHLANPMHEPGADIALLFLAMKLSTTTIPSGAAPQTQEYQDVKTLFHYVEASNGFSIQTLHALLLISLYEVGHGIYPAAYLSIGHAARIGHAMGLHHRSAPKMLAPCVTWTESEERRRVWWAILILDRFVSAGNSGKPFATADPSLEMHLPSDDDTWDRGVMAASAPLALSASQSVRTTPFARTCQASHLLGKIRRHLNDDSAPMDFRLQEAQQLHRATRALSEVLPDEARLEDPVLGNASLGSSLGICYSGLLTLYDAYSCGQRVANEATEGDIIMQSTGIEGLSELSALVLAMGRGIRACAERKGLEGVSPFVIECLYQAAANYRWYLHESSSPEAATRYAEAKEILTFIDQRWKVAGEYLRILEANEFSSACWSVVTPRSSSRAGGAGGSGGAGGGGLGGCGAA